jgi:ribonucleoside-diphosphate reductase alpha chain
MMPDVNPSFVARAQAEEWYSEELMARIVEEGHIHFPEVPEEVQAVFKTAHDISPEWHVRMQAAFQEHTDSAISKTTNFPMQATEDDVRKIYQLAYELDCKGVTVYRDGSRSGQVLSTGKTGKDPQENPRQNPQQSAEDHGDGGGDVAALEQMLADARESLHGLRMELEQLHREREDADQTAAATRHKRQRPAMLRGRTLKMNSPLGDLYVTINEDESGHPFEVFCTLGKAGGAATADAEAIGRLISLALRSGIPVSAVKDQLRGVSSDRAVGVGPTKVLSLPDAIGQAIERYMAEKDGVQETLPFGVAVDAGGAQTQSTSGGAAHSSFFGSCPECGAGQLSFEEGCVKCHICGYSQCG